MSWHTIAVGINHIVNPSHSSVVIEASIETYGKSDAVIAGHGVDVLDIVDAL